MKLLSKRKKPMGTVSTLQRRILVENAQYLVDRAGVINYAEIRPMTTHFLATMAQLKAYLNDHTITMDCSEAVTDLCRWSGLRDPNGLSFDGFGNTDTMYQHLPHYTNIDDAHLGALLIFGFNPTVHVCMLMEPDGANPWLFSHGSEIGPLRIRLDQERLAHVGQRETWLDIGNL
jgi:hypothetical protein